MTTKARFDRYVELLDTTLRDGEQTPGVAFTPAEKLQIARMLLAHVRVDRLEVGSARVSEGEQEGVSRIIEWADKHNFGNRVEILGFVDNGKSINWIANAGGKTINLLGKGSLRHCRGQLGKTPQEHYDDVCREIELACKKGLAVNVYLEDWSWGMRESFDYVYGFCRTLRQLPVQRIMLPDTLGILAPSEVTRYLELLYGAFPDARFDFHGHNDYNLVTANSLAAVKAGACGVHATVNGLGERAGNQPLAVLAVAIRDMTERRTRINEKKLYALTAMVQLLSGKRCSWNTPVVGTDVFTQTCGVHADGDKKGNLYSNALLPERFGRKRNYALGKLSGKASLEQNLNALALELPGETMSRVLEEIVRLGDRKKQVTPADLPFIIASVVRSPQTDGVRIENYEIVTSSKREPKAHVVLNYFGELIEAESSGDGGYDAFVKALRLALKSKGFPFPRLLDYEVRIPPGGKTDALVETTIRWGGEMFNGELTTVGVEADQLQAAIRATERMLNLAAESLRR